MTPLDVILWALAILIAVIAAVIAIALIVGIRNTIRTNRRRDHHKRSRDIYTGRTDDR
ncbi:hypothetical protein [Microbacterium sp. G2-8]|uniref:hypothetical protein n=1 Tax=Microbacterium sp. G2-8 TaxID=2842454 RepID=UPI001C8985A4|nr:hypothetical protein [Microbacterium sp. G2-8]